ncbi:hypothetical protein [Catenuloplanes atrovinosus]
MSDRPTVVPRQDGDVSDAVPAGGVSVSGAGDAEATQAINTGRGLYQSGSVAPSGRLAPVSTDGPGEPASFQPGRAGGEADVTAPISRTAPDAGDPDVTAVIKSTPPADRDKS